MTQFVNLAQNNVYNPKGSHEKKKVYENVQRMYLRSKQTSKKVNKKKARKKSPEKFSKKKVEGVVKKWR